MDSALSGNFALAMVVDRRKLHSSKLQSLIAIHWKLHGSICVVKQWDHSFLLQFQFEEDLLFMLSHGAWLLQGFFISLSRWHPTTNLSQVSVHSFPVWIQVHGLSSKYFNVKTTSYIGGKLGKFICYDEQSVFKGNGFRLKIHLSELGFHCLNFDKLQLLDCHILEVSLVLEQVGRFCPHCLSIGHVARHCKMFSQHQPRVTISIVGSKSSNIEYNDNFNCYNSNVHRNGIKLSVSCCSEKPLTKFSSRSLVLADATCLKRKMDIVVHFRSRKRQCFQNFIPKNHNFDQELDSHVSLSQKSKCPLSLDQTLLSRKRKFRHQHMSPTSCSKDSMLHFEEENPTCETLASVELLSRKVENPKNPNQFQTVRKK